jgi:hypothetical protein
LYCASANAGANARTAARPIRRVNEPLGMEIPRSILKCSGLSPVSAYLNIKRFVSLRLRVNWRWWAL